MREINIGSKTKLILNLNEKHIIAVSFVRRENCLIGRLNPLATSVTFGRFHIRRLAFLADGNITALLVPSHTRATVLVFSLVRCRLIDIRFFKILQLLVRAFTVLIAPRFTLSSRNLWLPIIHLLASQRPHERRRHGHKIHWSIGNDRRNAVALSCFLPILPCIHRPHRRGQAPCM